MNPIEQMLIGKLTLDKFINLINSDQNVLLSMNALIPQEAKLNCNHTFWRVISYSALNEDGFCLWNHIKRICQFDGTIGDNLNLFGTIQAVYLYHYPDTVCTRIYEDLFDLYLDVVKDCFDGPEVEHIIQRILQYASSIKGKGKRIALAKQEIQRFFHNEGSKRPRWIQGPEWPMGKNSPMKFISQKRNGDKVDFLFQDIDTNEMRTIRQFY